MGACCGKPNPLNNYKLAEELGAGAFSTVYRARKVDTNQEVAVKISRKQELSPEDVIGIRQEVEIMQSFNHRNIVRFYSFFENDQNFYTVLEIVQGGQLFDRIAQKKKYDENEARDLVKILLEAIKYCHDRGVAHRDLKPENLLMSSTKDDADIKIADFGFAKRCQGSSLTTPLGSPAYVAPEILMQRKYGVAVDMWSIGVIIFTMIGGQPPFAHHKESEMFKLIKTGNYTFNPKHWGHIDQSCKDLVAGLLTVDPAKRLTADQALKLRWVDDRMSSIDLTENLAEFRKFNAARKFRSAANAVIAMNRMKFSLSSLSDLGSRSTDTGADENVVAASEVSMSPMATQSAATPESNQV